MRYKVECVQADGTLFTVKTLPMCYKEALEVKREYASVFTRCKWRVVAL